MKSLDCKRDQGDLPVYRRLHKHQLLDQLRQAVSFRHVAICGLDFDGYRFGDRPSIDTDMPPAYVETYLDENWGNLDPLILLTQKLARPMSDVEAFEISPPPQRLLYLLRAYEVGSRFLVPVLRNRTVFGAVCFSGNRIFDEAERKLLAFLAEPLHREITQLLASRIAVDVLRLTERELTCLRLAGQGLTSEQIAAAIALQTETVNSQMKSATRKLGAQNRAHAIAEAIRRQIIS